MKKSLFFLVLVVCGVAVYGWTRMNQRELFDGARLGDPLKIEGALKWGAGIDKKNNNGTTALGIAAKYNGKEAAKTLVKRGADKEVRDPLGQTPLHIAIMSGSNDVAEYLISNGADVNATDLLGNTPMHDVAKKSNMIVALELISYGAKVNEKNLEGKTPLDLAWGNMKDFLSMQGSMSTVPSNKRS